MTADSLPFPRILLLLHILSLGNRIRYNRLGTSNPTESERVLSNIIPTPSIHDQLYEGYEQSR